MQKNQINNQHGLHKLLSAMILKACKDAPKKGYTGYEARLWLEYFAIPALEEMEINTENLQEFVKKPYKLPGKIRG